MKKAVILLINASLLSLLIACGNPESPPSRKESVPDVKEAPTAAFHEKQDMAEKATDSDDSGKESEVTVPAVDFAYESLEKQSVQELVDYLKAQGVNARYAYVEKATLYVACNGVENDGSVRTSAEALRASNRLLRLTADPESPVHAERLKKWIVKANGDVSPAGMITIGAFMPLPNDSGTPSEEEVRACLDSVLDTFGYRGSAFTLDGADQLTVTLLGSPVTVYHDQAENICQAISRAMDGKLSLIALAVCETGDDDLYSYYLYDTNLTAFSAVGTIVQS